MSRRIEKVRRRPATATPRPKNQQPLFSSMMTHQMRQFNHCKENDKENSGTNGLTQTEYPDRDDHRKIAEERQRSEIEGIISSSSSISNATNLKRKPEVFLRQNALELDSQLSLVNFAQSIPFAPQPASRPSKSAFSRNQLTTVSRPSVPTAKEAVERIAFPFQPTTTAVRRRIIKARLRSTFSLTQFKTSSCLHGWNYGEYPEGHPCHTFIKEIVENCVLRNNIPVLTTTSAIMLNRYKEIWNDNLKLEWIALAFIGIAVQDIIEGDKYISNKCIQISDWIHQSLSCEPEINNARLAELRSGDIRRVVSYLHRRTPCSCLDTRYKEVKHLPKIGRCNGPFCFHRQIEIGKMWSCEGCRREHYCSERCQYEAWPLHKAKCKVYREWKASKDVNDLSASLSKMNID